MTVSFQSHNDDAMLRSTWTKKVRCNHENIDDCKISIYQRLQTEFTVTGYLVERPE